MRVFASTSNLGPGFDCLGIALSIPLEVTLEPGPAEGDRPGPDTEPWGPFTGEAQHWPRNGSNLVLRAFAAGAGAPPPAGARLSAHSEIPLGRGLGSSGAAVAAGLLLGEAHAPAPTSDRELLVSRAVELEGHPDNVTPALLGGARLAWPGSPRSRSVPVHPSLAFALAWPDLPSSTAAARAALPDQVPHRHAVETAPRLALLLAGLESGDPELLAAGNVEHLHVPFRLPLIPGAAEALEAGRAAGAPLATLSGSGSAVVAVVDRGRAAEVAEAMAASFRRSTGAGTARVAEVVHGAPRVEAAGDPAS